MKKKVIIVIAFVVLVVMNLLLLLPYIKTEENVLENNRIDRDKTYAIMVQNEDKSGYVESESNTFPSGMTLNEELTNCVDESGNKVTNPFTYENGIVTVRTSKKIYCYLYFDANASFGNQLLQNPTSGLNTTLEGGLYRYQGTEVDNYICFGTSDKDTCLGNTDAYLYRIIGVSEDGRIKVLKNYALESTMKWYSSNTSNKTWPSSTIFSSIKDSSFLTNTSYMPSGWEDKIEITSWKYGDNTDVNITADALYNIENAWTDTVDAKIGLIYAHDYAYAYQSGGLNCSQSGSYTTCKTAWMFIGVSDSEAPSAMEWTMSRYGLSGSNYTAWYVHSNGRLGNGSQASYSYSVRPVFFLKSDIELIGGTGKSDDPFIIS